MASYGKFLETFPMKILTHLEKVCLNEINSFFMNLVKLIYKQHLCHLTHY
jgi:hypothetical protein